MGVNIRKIVLFGLGVLVATSLSSCARYNASSLNSLASSLAMQERAQTRNNEIYGIAKVFNKIDCVKYLGRDVLSVGFQPIQIYIENKSEKSYAFDTNRLSLQCVPIEFVSEKVHTSTLARASAYGVGSLFIWPLVIPAIVDGVMSSQANKALDIDYQSKVADNQIIHPYTRFNKVIFVPLQEYQPNFTMLLLETQSKETKKIHFNAI